MELAQATEDREFPAELESLPDEVREQINRGMTQRQFMDWFAAEAADIMQSDKGLGDDALLMPKVITKLIKDSAVVVAYEPEPQEGEGEDEFRRRRVDERVLILGPSVDPDAI